MLISDSIEFRGDKVEDSVLSDHRPVIAEAGFAAENKGDKLETGG